MSRTWLVRGVAVAVFAVLVGAWALGLAGLGGTSAPPARLISPVSPDSSPAAEIVRSIVLEKAKPRRTRKADPTQEAVTEPSPDATDEPTDASGTTAPPSPAPTSGPPSPSEEPPDSPTPSNPPSEPDDECDGMGDAIDCVLDPITGRP
jgi:hypothetical protein